MKKAVVMVLVVVLLAAILGFTPVRAAAGVVVQITVGSTKAYINSKTVVLDQPPIIENGRTLVPFRFIGEAIGATIGWDPVKKTVSYVLGDKSIVLTIGSITAMVNGVKTTLDVAPKILSTGRTVVPVRFISESVGAQVDWNATTRMVTVTVKPREPVTITYWYWADTAAYSAKMQEIAGDFNATNISNIKVVAEEYPWGGGAYSQTLFTAAMGGGGPDTSSFKLTSTPLFTANKLLANLDSYISTWSDKADIDSSLYATMTQAGGTGNEYVMPWNTQVLYVYYRPSMFKAAGVTVPRTYDEFLTACRKLTRDTNGDGKTDVYGFGMRGAKGGQEPWGSFIWARGGDFKDLTSAKAVAGMQDFIDLYKNGYVPPTATNDGFNEIIANFKSGKTAMTVHHIGSSKDMVATFGDDVDAFVFPAGVNQWTSMGDTDNVIFAKCTHKDAAFQWLAYLATGKGQETWCTTTGNVPVSKRVQQLPQFQNDKFMKISIQGQPHAGIFPILDTTTDWINTIWPNTVQGALMGKSTAAEAMKILQQGLYGTN